MEEREREDTVNSEEALISIPLVIETFFPKSERGGSEVGGKYVRTSPYPDGFSALRSLPYRPVVQIFICTGRLSEGESE